MLNRKDVYPRKPCRSGLNHVTTDMANQREGIPFKIRSARTSDTYNVGLVPRWALAPRSPKKTKRPPRRAASPDGYPASQQKLQNSSPGQSPRPSPKQQVEPQAEGVKQGVSHHSASHQERTQVQQRHPTISKPRITITSKPSIVQRRPGVVLKLVSGQSKGQGKSSSPKRPFNG